MNLDDLQTFDIPTEKAREIQNKYSKHVIKTDQFGTIGKVAGVDIGVKKDIACAAVIVLSYPELEILDGVVVKSHLNFPYVPGYLSFREIPPLLLAFSQLETEPDLVIVDGQGVAHPRRFGLACHLGLILDKPTIGCAKSRLCGEYVEPGTEKGSFSYLYDKEEEIGIALRTRTNVSVVFVSIGHLISLETARVLTLACCPRYRLPETTRYAHKAASNNIPDGVKIVSMLNNS